MEKKICIIGTGYVGLITALGLAEFGHIITAVDVNEQKITLLQQKKSPIYEADIDTYLQKHSNESKLKFSTDIAKGISHNDIIIIAVGTPMDKQGYSNLQYLNNAVQLIAQHSTSPKVIIIKSTVPIGTNAQVKKRLVDLTQGKIDFTLISNPEFLREGRALYDFFSSRPCGNWYGKH